MGQFPISAFIRQVIPSDALLSSCLLLYCYKSIKYNQAMAFEPRVVEARLALNLISSAEMPRLAWEGLEAEIGN
jgi:hypothetical protein